MYIGHNSDWQVENNSEKCMAETEAVMINCCLVAIEIKPSGILPEIGRLVLDCFLEKMQQLMKGNTIDGGRLLELTPKLDTDGARRLGRRLHLAPDMNINPYLIRFVKRV